MISRLLKWFGLNLGSSAYAPKIQKKTEPPKTHTKTHILSRKEHIVSRNNISKPALKVLYRLKDAGFEAFLVGGGVRDLLLGLHPKDFDVATNAKPEDIYKLFRNSRIIGRRFKLVHVHFSGYIIEVATFRSGQALTDEISGESSDVIKHKDGMILRDNIYGSLEEDIWRRDFTINALYYNIADFTLLDKVGGLSDLSSKTIRIIGDPKERFREDPLRMLRAIRFAAKLGFEIDSKTADTIFELGHLIHQVPGARLFDEYIKLFLSGHALQSFRLLRQFRLFGLLFPQTEFLLEQEEQKGSTGQSEPAEQREHSAEKIPNQMLYFIEQALTNTDNRVKEGLAVTSYFLIAVFLWHPVLFKKTSYTNAINGANAFQEATDHVIKMQQKHFPIPKRLLLLVREVLSFQKRFTFRNAKRVKYLFNHVRFKAAYDFLKLRAESGDTEAVPLSAWWQIYLSASEEKQNELINAFKDPMPRRRKRRGRTHLL